MAARTVSCNAPEAAIIRNNLGHLLLETGRNDEAAREFEAARKVLGKRLPARGHPHLSMGAPEDGATWATSLNGLKIDHRRVNY
jgi:hypothetical protein